MTGATALSGFPARLRRVGSLRKHRVFAVVLATAVALRILAVIGQRPALLFEKDSYFYLQDSRTLQPDSFHTVVYALFLWALHGTGTLTSVSVAQHVLGLLTGLCVYVMCVRHGVRPWIAALAAAPVLLDMYQIVIEQFVLADAFANSLLALSVLLASRRFRGSHVLAGLVFSVAALTRTVLLAALPALIVLAWRTRQTGRRRFQVPALLLAVALPLVAYAGWMQADTGQFTLDRTVALQEYGRVADFANCSILHLTASERMLCDPLAPAKRRSPNWFMWARESPLWRHFPPPHTQPWLFPSSVTGGFAEKVLIAQPVQFVSSVGTYFIHYFSPYRHEYEKAGSVGSLQFPTSTHRVQNVYPGNRGFPIDASGTRLALVRPVIVKPVAKFLHRLQKVLYTPGPLLAAAALLGLFSYFVAWRRRRELNRELRGLSAHAAGLALGGLSLLLATAIGGAFDWRYMLPVLILLPPAGAMGLEALLQCRTAPTTTGVLAGADTYGVTRTYWPQILLPRREHEPAGVSSASRLADAQSSGVDPSPLSGQGELGPVDDLPPDSGPGYL